MQIYKITPFLLYQHKLQKIDSRDTILVNINLVLKINPNFKDNVFYFSVEHNKGTGIRLIYDNINGCLEYSDRRVKFEATNYFSWENYDELLDDLVGFNLYFNLSPFKIHE